MQHPRRVRELQRSFLLVLDRDADGFVKGYFVSAESSRFGAVENFADLGVNHVVTDAFFFQCQQDVAALRHDRLTRVNHDFGLRQSRPVDLTRVGTMGADGVNMDTGL